MSLDNLIGCINNESKCAIGVYGLLAYGLYQKSKADNYYSDYQDAIKQSDINSNYDNANKANHQYIIASRASLAIWLVDIGWVLYQGYNKERNTKYIEIEPSLMTLNGNPNIQLSFKIRL